MSHRVYWSCLALGGLASAVFVAGLATQWLLIGSTAGAWTYRYLQPFSFHFVVVGALAGAAAGAALRLPLPEFRREWMLVLAWLAIALALQAFVRSVTPFPFDRIFVSDGANSFYSVSERHDALSVLTDFNRLRRDAPLHAQSNMPGKLMFLYALRLVSERPDILPWLVVIASNLGGVLMYLFVRDVFDDRTVALYAMVLYLLVPAKLVFFPLMNTFTVVPVLACLCVLVRWLRTGVTWWPAVLGAGLYGLVFFEPLPLVMGILFAALTLRAVLRDQLTWSRFILQSCLMLIVFVLTAEAMRWVFGFDLVDSFRRLRQHAIAFNATAGRPYGTWVWANLWEFTVAMGVCQAVLFVCALATGVLDGGTFAERLSRPITIVSVSLGAVLLAVDLIGINRGEVVRLWIFLACFFQIPAAYVCAQLRHPAGITIVASTSLIQAAVGTGMVGFIVP